MSQPVYTMHKKKGTEELHLFEGRMTKPPPNAACSVPAYSICRGMEKADAEGSPIFACQPEDVTRKSAANKGRRVCGTCVSHLYTTFP